MNLGVGLLTRPTTVDNLLGAISKFDADDATAVCAYFRKVAGAGQLVEEHIRIYNQAKQTNDRTTADERSLATASWIEEIGVSHAHRRWLNIAKETGAWRAPPEHALLLDLLKTNAKTLDSNQNTVLQIGEELSALSNFAGEIKRLYNGVLPLSLRRMLPRARGRA